MSHELEHRQLPEISGSLGSLEKTAGRIEQNLEALDSHVTFSILGTLHTGNISKGIKGAIDNATSVSVELPSIAVKSYLREEESNISKSSFWSQVVDYCRQTGTPVEGVHNNAAAILSIRVLDDRVRKGFAPSKTTPDVIISTQDEDLARDIIKAPQSHFDRVKGVAFPFVGIETREGKDFIFYQYRGLPMDPNIAAVSLGHALPIEFWMHNSDLFADVQSEDFLAHDALQKALDHLMRLNVDKTQSREMIDPIDKMLKKAIREKGTVGAIQHLHIGGAAHNPNITGVLESVFSSDRVLVQNIRDERIPPITEDELTFFSRHIDVPEGLSATAVQHDHVVVDIDKARSLLGRVAEKIGREGFVSFGNKRSLVRSYFDMYQKETPGSFTLWALLSLIPKRYELGIDEVTSDTPFELAEKIRRDFPQLDEQIDEIMEIFAKSEEYYPGSYSDLGSNL